MSQPPDEPTPRDPAGDSPDEGWQAPGPPPDAGPPPAYPPYPFPYGQPPQQNPYGGGTSEVYRPIDSGGMPSAVKVVLGVVIGLFGGFVLWIMAAIGFASAGTGDEFLLLAALAPLIVPAPLLFWPVTRPWGVGLLIGTAISSIGLSSLCSSMLTSM